MIARLFFTLVLLSSTAYSASSKSGKFIIDEKCGENEDCLLVFEELRQYEQLISKEKVSFDDLVNNEKHNYYYKKLDVLNLDAEELVQAYFDDCGGFIIRFISLLDL